VRTSSLCLAIRVEILVLAGDNGVIDFCQFPKEVEKKEEIFWAPIFPDGVENPWGVKIVDIKIQFEQ
jgi:hypothetical protein